MNEEMKASVNFKLDETTRKKLKFILEYELNQNYLTFFPAIIEQFFKDWDNDEGRAKIRELYGKPF